MKCPVCGKENQSMRCPKCGFDASRDYGRYPAFGPVSHIRSESAVREEWQEKQKLPEPVKKPRRKLGWILAALVCLVMVALGIGIGLGLGGAESWKENLLGSDILQYQSSDPYDWTEESYRYPVFGSQYQRQEIKSVTFLDTLKDQPADAWDVSLYGDGSVMAWVKPSGDLYDLYIGAEGGINAAEACTDLFAGYANCERIRFSDAFHTDEVTSMYSMFSDCLALTSLDLSSFDTAKVEDMAYMFWGCESLRKLDLRSFDTEQVLDMSGMFGFCYCLEQLDLSSFDTAGVLYMTVMFAYCESLIRVDLRGFDTSSLQDTENMFAECPAGADWAHLLK